MPRNDRTDRADRTRQVVTDGLGDGLQTIEAAGGSRDEMAFLVAVAQVQAIVYLGDCIREAAASSEEARDVG